MSVDTQATPVAKFIAIMLLVLVVIASITLIYFIFAVPCCEEESDHGFGDSSLNGTYYADAYALTTGGLPVGGGIEPLADPPTVVFSEDFEGTETWSLDDATTDSLSAHYWGAESAYLDPTIDGDASANYTFSAPIEVATDETIEIYFYILASSAWDLDGGDFFALNVTFTGEKSLVYVMLGTYMASDDHEKVISVGSQVTAKGMWIGINLQRIDDDYVIQFGSSLPIPSIVSVGFILQSSATEDVYVDEMEIVVLPRAVESGSYWKKIPSGELVSSYFVEVGYTIYVSGDVNPTSVYAEMKLWIEIYDGDAPATLLLPKTLVQDEVIPNVEPEVLNEWTSKAFALPEDDAAFGDDLIYAFYIQIEAWGSLVTEPTTWVYGMDDNGGEDFDSLHFEWILIDGGIEVVITSLYVFGSLGTVITIVGIARARKRGRGDRIVDLKLTEKESWYN